MVTREHDPYWFEDDSEVFEDYTPHRNTDYNFPPNWGMLTDEQKAEWFLEQRVRDQMKRQYDAGMWDQWDEDRLSNGVTFEEAWNMAGSNQYRKK